MIAEIKHYPSAGRQMIATQQEPKHHPATATRRPIDDRAYQASSNRSEAQIDKMIAETKHYPAIGKASLSCRPD